MQKQPSEIIVDHILPPIRAQLAKELVDCDISQQRIARILGLTPAAVSQYMSKKRGYAVEFDEDVLKELRVIAGYMLLRHYP